MSDWYNSQKKPSSNFRKLLLERIDKANPRRTPETPLPVMRSFKAHHPEQIHPIRGRRQTL